MKKIFKYFASAIVLAGFVFVSCSKEDLTPVSPEEDGVMAYTLTITASREKTPDTKLLELGGADNKTLYKKWALYDEVSVYKGSTLAGTLTATTVSSSGFDATLTGQLTGTTISPGDDLVMKFGSQVYSTQDGTLAGIASTCDYAEAEVTVATIDGSGNITTTKDALFKNQQAIVKFTLQDEAANLISATSLTVEVSGMSDIVVTPGSATSELFVAVPGIEAKDITLTAVVNGKEFTCKKSAATLENSKYYGIKASMFNAYYTPLTLEAKSSGTISFFLKDHTDIQPITYRLNNGSPVTISKGSTETINVSAGDRVTFYGNNSFYGDGSSPNYTTSSKISGTADCYVYGNIMSLIDAENFATLETINHDNTFSDLFVNNTHLYNHSWKDFILPAKNVKKSSYAYMFYGCTKLSKAPELPATSVAQGCYQAMFSGCSNLVDITLTLPATDLAADEATACYISMFQNCSKITRAPSLRSTTIITNCYFSMFDGCTNLEDNIPSTLPGGELKFCCYKQMFKGCTKIVTAPSFAVTSTAAMECCYGMFSGCTKLETAPSLSFTEMEGNYNCWSMFYGCTSLTNVPDLPNVAALTQRCYQYMFSGCSNLENAPLLPNTTLVDACYNGMFQNCTKLNYVKCLATNPSASSTPNWLGSVAATGTFVKDPDTTWETGVAGIPDGWTVEDNPVTQ